MSDHKFVNLTVMVELRHSDNKAFPQLRCLFAVLQAGLDGLDIVKERQFMITIVDLDFFCSRRSVLQ
jgi:hypothetical protein